MREGDEPGSFDRHVRHFYERIDLLRQTAVLSLFYPGTQCGWCFTADHARELWRQWEYVHRYHNRLPSGTLGKEMALAVIKRLARTPHRRLLLKDSLLWRRERAQHGVRYGRLSTPERRRLVDILVLLFKRLKSRYRNHSVDWQVAQEGHLVVARSRLPEVFFVALTPHPWHTDRDGGYLQPSRLPTITGRGVWFEWERKHPRVRRQPRSRIASV